MSDTLAKTNSQSPPTGGGKGFNPLSLAVPFITMLADNWLYDKRQQKQFEREDAYWQRNADYNTASSQVARLKDAGLSPNLAYGSVDSGNMSAMPNSVSPRGANLDPMSLAQIKNIEAQTANINANTQLATEQSSTQTALQVLYESEADLNLTEAKKNAQELENLTLKYNEIQSNIDLLKKQFELYDEEKRAISINNWINDKSKWEQMYGKRYDFLFRRKEYELLNATFASQVLGFELDNNYKSALIRATNAQKQLTEKQIGQVVEYAKNLRLCNTELANNINAKVTTRTEDGMNSYKMTQEFIKWQFENRDIHYWADKGVQVLDGAMGMFSFGRNHNTGSFQRYGEVTSEQIEMGNKTKKTTKYK